MDGLIEIKSFADTHIKDYKKLTPKAYAGILKISKKIRGKTIIHINATPCGGGVAELLKSRIPLERSLGLKSHWFAINAPRYFYVITKEIHNLLQGKGGALAEKEKSAYLEINRQLGKSFQGLLRHLKIKNGVIVVHDPQPLPIIHFIPQNFHSILRLHIDLSTPNPAIIDFLKPFIEQYQQVILSNKDYLASLPWLKKAKSKIILPAIDPFTEKNQPMDSKIARNILEQFNVNCAKPIITQVSRFDPWKDPLGVIRAYYLAKNKIPDLQLILAGIFLAKDDPEAISVFRQVQKHGRGDPDIHLFSNIERLQNISNDSFINALYTASTLMIQGSIREGFGLTITESMWKGKVVVARMTSGSLIQIKNNKNGVLASSPEKASRAIVRLIKDKKLRNRLGKAAAKSVKRHFLMSRFILDNIRLYSRAAGN